MTENFDLAPDLDARLRDSISHQDDFLSSVGFVLALLNFKVIAPNPLFSVKVSDHEALPIFTTEADWEVFTSSLTDLPDSVKWQAIPFTVVFDAVLGTPIDSIAFNLKTSTDKDSGNLYYFDKEKLREFIDVHNHLMGDLMSDENLAADRLEKYYLVPVYITSRSYGDLVRLFPTLASPNYDDKEVIPIFDNLESFARWYRYPDFGGAFKEKNGQIRGMHLSELIHPAFGENEFGHSVGVVINPMEVKSENQADSILTWESLRDLKKSEE